MKTKTKIKGTVSFFKPRPKYDINAQFVHYYYFAKDGNDYGWFERQLQQAR